MDRRKKKTKNKKKTTENRPFLFFLKENVFFFRTDSSCYSQMKSRTQTHTHTAVWLHPPTHTHNVVSFCCCQHTRLSFLRSLRSHKKSINLLLSRGCRVRSEPKTLHARRQPIQSFHRLTKRFLILFDFSAETHTQTDTHTTL